MPARYARRYGCLFIRASRSQVIKQSRNRVRKKQEGCGDCSGERPINPGHAKRRAFRIEAEEHLRPEVALKLCVLQGRELALEKRAHLLFVLLIFDFVAHFAAASKPRELSFLRSMRTARKTRTLTRATEMPAASAISL